jgi:uncharacterized protein (DUF433 family)
MNLSKEHIVSDPDICMGKPRIAGTQFTVKDAVIQHHSQGMSLIEISTNWKLPLPGVYAAMAYYHDHKVEIDQELKDDKEFVRKLRARNEALLEEIRHASLTEL